MRLKFLAPHQIVDGVEVPPGDVVEVASRTRARQLVSSGYALPADDDLPATDTAPVEQVADDPAGTYTGYTTSTDTDTTASWETTE